MYELLCDRVRRNIERPQFHHCNKPIAYIEVDTRTCSPIVFGCFSGRTERHDTSFVSAVISNDALEQKLLDASDD